MNVPENFKKIIRDMTDDFSRTFPEYSHLWSKWTTNSMNGMDSMTLEKEIRYLYDYTISVYPERFFDIIYQNEDLFSINCEVVNTNFLPGIDFFLLFNSDGVSDRTKNMMWNYLKLILLNNTRDYK